MVLLVHSKSNAWISASRTRGSLNLLAAGIDEPALRARRRIVRQYLALDAAILHGRKIIARRPYPRGEFLAIQVILGGKAFKGDIAVTVEFVTHNIEIILPRLTGSSAPHQSLTRSNSM